MAEAVAGLPSVPIELQEADDQRPAFRWWTTAAACVAFGLLFGALCLIRARGLGKPVTFDLGNYEYYSGYAELHGYRGPMALPGQWETYLDAQVNTIYYLLITHLSSRRVVEAIALLQSLSVSLLALIVWRGVRSSTGNALVAAFAGVVAGGGAFLSPIFRIELAETSSDVILSLLLFAAAALLYRVVVAPAQGSASYRNAALAGILLGLAGELKFTEAAFSAAIFVGFCVAVTLARSRAGCSYGRCLGLAATVLVPAVVIAGALYLPMALMLWHRYRDPFFPFFNGIFHSPDLRAGDFSIGYTAHTPAGLWSHFTALLGADKHLIYHSPVESPILFFSLVFVAGMLVLDLVKKDKPQAVFIEVSLLLSFLLWAVVLGFYRYLAPVEMAAAAVVVMLVALHRLHRLALLVILACAVAFSPLYSAAPVLGAQRRLGNTYFTFPPNAFKELRGAGVVLAGGGPLGFLVPHLPASTEVVRGGGQLELAMSTGWWSHVAGVVQHSHRTWWVLFALLSRPLPARVIPPALRQLGFPGPYHSCRDIKNGIVNVRICRVMPATSVSTTASADLAR